MAILQSRMMAVINAGLDYQQALETILERFRLNKERISQGRMSYQQAYEDFESIASTRILLQRPTQSPTALAVEHYHFTRNARRNAKVAAHQAELRRLQGIPERQHLTSPLATSDEIYQPGATRQPNQNRLRILLCLSFDLT